MWRWSVQPIPSLIDRKTKWQYPCDGTACVNRNLFSQLHPLPLRKPAKIKLFFPPHFLTNSHKSISTFEPSKWWGVFLFSQTVSGAGPLIRFHQVRQLSDLPLKMKLLLPTVTPTHQHLTQAKKDTFLLVRSHFLSRLLWEEDLACFGMVELFGSLFDVGVRDR